MVVRDGAFEAGRVIEVAGCLDARLRPETVLAGSGERSVVEDVLLLDVVLELISPFFLFDLLDFSFKGCVDGCFNKRDDVKSGGV